MNFKRKLSNLKTKQKLEPSKINTQQSTGSLGTQILQYAVVFSMIWAINPVYSQCTVHDLPDSTQNKIVKTHYERDECLEKRIADSTRIAGLEVVNTSLVKDNTRINTKFVKSKNRRWIWFGFGAATGWFSRKVLY